MAHRSTGDKLVENMPSNPKIEKSLDRAAAELEIAKRETQGLDATGRRILDDAQALVTDTKEFVREKNEGEKLQRLLKEGQLASEGIGQETQRLKGVQDETLGRIDSDRLRRLAKETLQTSRMAAMELVRSARFRKSIKDFGQLASDIIAKGEAADLGDKKGVQHHDQEGLHLKNKENKIHHAVEKGLAAASGMSSSGGVSSSSNVPIAPPPPREPLTTTTTSTSTTTSHALPRTGGTYTMGTAQTGGVLTGGSGLSHYLPTGDLATTTTGGTGGLATELNDESTMIRSASPLHLGGQGFNLPGTSSGLSSGTSHIPPAPPAPPVEHVGTRSFGVGTGVSGVPSAPPAPPVQKVTRGFGHLDLNEKPGLVKKNKNKGAKLSSAVNKGLKRAGASRRVELNDEQIAALAHRFNGIIQEITRRENSRKVFENLLEIFRLFGEEGMGDNTMMKEHLKGTASNIREDEHIRNTLRLAQEIFETFTGNKTLDPMIGHFRDIGAIFRKDPDARAYFVDLRHFLLDILHNPDRLGTKETNDAFGNFVRRARQLHDEKLYDHLNGVIYEGRELVHRIETDPATNRLRQDMKRLIADIMLDNEGNIVMKPEVIEQLRLIIVQSLVERMRIPVPTIHVDNPDMEFTLSNVVVAMRDLVPERIVMKNMGKMALDLSNIKETVDTQTEGQALVFKIKNINMHIEDADIWFRRKKFPKVQDEGKARMDIGGRGVDLRVVIRTYLRAQNFFRPEVVSCDVHKMGLHLSDTRHDFLYNTMLKVMSGKIKRNVERSIENNLRDYLDRLNHMLTKQLEKRRAGTKSMGQAIKERVKSTAEQTTGLNLGSSHEHERTVGHAH